MVVKPSHEMILLGVYCNGESTIIRTIVGKMLRSTDKIFYRCQPYNIIIPYLFLYYIIITVASEKGRRNCKNELFTPKNENKK